jgi:ABC-type antimicrobial peptide transport system permease subunit
MMSLGYGMNEAMDKMLGEWADLTLIDVYNWGMVNEFGNEVPPMTDDVIKTFQAIPNVKSVMPFYNNFQVGRQIAVYNSDGKALEWTPLVGVYMDELENFGFALKEGRFKQQGDSAATVLFGEQVGESVVLFEEGTDAWGNPVYEWAEWDWETWQILSLPVDHLNDEWFIIPLTMDMNVWQADYSVIGSQTAPNMEYNEELNVVGVLEGNWSVFETMRGIFIDIAYMKGLIEAFNDLNPDAQMEFDGEYSTIKIRANDMDDVAAIEEEISAMGYQTWSANEMRENMMQQVRMIQMLLAALAAVSLFVAALNIANTMITAVIERTREIGIMKVLGCDVSKILFLFLGEAALIGFIGGVLGIGFSYLLSFILNTFLMEALMQAMGGGYMAMDGVSISSIPFFLPFLGLGVATAVGVFAGFYPAFRGTRISALSAIAHE